MSKPLVLMTGATSGIGLYAARRLLTEGADLIVGARGSGAPVGAEVLPVDLASLSATARFAAQAMARANGRPFDALVLNAGGSLADGRSAEGYELNFAVNHLAHYALLRHLLPHLAHGARVVITTSGTHDPEAGARIPAPRHADAERLAYPDTDHELDSAPARALGRAYSAAKLCNLLTARALATHPEARARDLHVIAYSPGPTPGTGLVSARGALMGLVWKHLLPAFRPLFAGLNSPRQAGEVMADLALGLAAPPAGRVYALLKRGELTFPDPSALARRDDVMEKMWLDSARLCGMTADRQAAE